APGVLDAMLDKSCGARPTVVVISACFSGVVVPTLARGNRMILTAARPDRSSFGCGESDKYPYFDDCFLQSMKAAHDFPGLGRAPPGLADAQEEPAPPKAEAPPALPSAPIPYSKLHPKPRTPPKPRTVASGAPAPAPKTTAAAPARAPADATSSPAAGPAPKPKPVPPPPVVAAAAPPAPPPAQPGARLGPRQPLPPGEL